MYEYMVGEESEQFQASRRFEGIWKLEARPFWAIFLVALGCSLASSNPPRLKRSQCGLGCLGEDDFDPVRIHADIVDKKRTAAFTISQEEANGQNDWSRSAKSVRI